MKILFEITSLCGYYQFKYKNEYDVETTCVSEDKAKVRMEMLKQAATYYEEQYTEAREQGKSLQLELVIKDDKVFVK